MNRRFLSLTLAGALSLTLLAGCAGGTDTPPASPTAPPASSAPVVSPSPEAQPSETPSQSPEASPAPEASDTPSIEPTDKPAPSAKPTEKPAPSAKPTEKPAPSARPTEKPSTDVVNQVWNEIAKQDLPTLIDVDSATLTALYGIDAGDLVSYVCKMPMAGVHATEFFIAQVKDGRMDAVKAGIAKRQSDLDQQWSTYLPEQYEMVQNYQVVTSGSYVLFVISDNPDAAVSAFQSYAK